MALCTNVQVMDVPEKLPSDLSQSQIAAHTEFCPSARCCPRTGTLGGRKGHELSELEEKTRPGSLSNSPKVMQPVRSQCANPGGAVCVSGSGGGVCVLLGAEAESHLAGEAVSPVPAPSPRHRSGSIQDWLSTSPFGPPSLAREGQAETGGSCWCPSLCPPSPGPSRIDSGIGGVWEGNRSHSHTLFGVPRLRVVTASQGADPGLARAWEGSRYCCHCWPSQEGRKRPQALLEGHMATFHLRGPLLPSGCQPRQSSGGNPSLSGRQGTEGGLPSTLEHNSDPRSPCSEYPSSCRPHTVA